jgi:hypothetical protein
MNEPTKKNPAAVALGRRGRGKPKNLTDDQRAALARRIRLVNERKAAAKAAQPEANHDWQDAAKRYEPV